MFKYLFFILIILLSGCQSIIINEKTNEPVEDNKGAYYLDDGPQKNVPKNLDEIPDAVPKDEPLYERASRPYEALGETYNPMKELKPFKEKGYASWYGKKYHGNKTSLGEIYDMYQMTGAHKTLPLPCYVKVTNLKNKRSVIIRVNDRGPFLRERIIDLSYAAAHKLDIIEKGSELVEIEVINPKFSQEMQNIMLQAGVFSLNDNAKNLQSKIELLKLNLVEEITIVNKNNNFHVWLGPFDDLSQAEEVKSIIDIQLNLNSIIID